MAHAVDSASLCEDRICVFLLSARMVLSVVTDMYYMVNKHLRLKEEVNLGR